MQMSEEITPPRPTNPASMTPSSSPAVDGGAMGDLRKEVVEARNLIIKNDNLLKNLHAELKQMGRKQEMFEGRHWMTSIVAYVIFTVLLGLGAYSLARAEIRVAREEASANESKVHQLSQDLEKLRAGEAAKREASEKAARVYDLLGTEKEETGKADKARAAYERAAGLYPGSEFAPMIRNRIRHLNAAANPTTTPAAGEPTQAQR